jgi:hypothetical protein
LNAPFFDSDTKATTLLNDEPTTLFSGWRQEEGALRDEAWVGHTLVNFDLAPEQRKGWTRATLTFNEAERQWTNGDGKRQEKPDGCVVVRLPSVDWTQSPLPRPFPYITDPRIPAPKRLGPREWDVTEPLRWQLDPAARPLSQPGTSPPNPGFGFLLTGGLSIDQLTGDDDAACWSTVSEIFLNLDLPPNVTGVTNDISDLGRKIGPGQPPADITDLGRKVGPDLPYGADTCKQGFVWREAFDGDHVCVTPETRAQAAADNAQAEARRSPTGGAWGPNTCLPGFVWRVARPEDLVCVTPATREQVAADNARADERRVVPRGASSTAPAQVARGCSGRPGDGARSLKHM